MLFRSPFAALTAFGDPGVDFGLQFRTSSEAKKPQGPREVVKDAPVEKLPAPQAKETPSTPSDAQPAAPESPSSPQVVSIDKFRKK